MDDNKKVVGLMIASFLVGDFLACVRANRHWQKQTKPLENENELLRMKCAAMAEYIVGMTEGTTPPEEVEKKFTDDVAFIEVAENEI